MRKILLLPIAKAASSTHLILAARCLAAAQMAHGFVIAKHQAGMRMQIGIDMLKAFLYIFVHGGFGYAKLFGGIDAILAAYQALNPNVNGLLQCLILFNLPFTFVKGLLDSALCFVIYKPLSPILHGRR